jgi:peptidyl-prolyl cis-trans isomerase D
MAMMAKMRSLAPWFIITVGGLFVLFMVLSDSKISDVINTRETNVGSINGVEISYQEFSRFVEQARANQVQQTGQEIDESLMSGFRDQIWDAVVKQTVMSQKIQELGITVTDEEILEVIMGENPPEYLKSSFIDSTGNFNRAAYEAALTDPRNREGVIGAEERVRQELIGKKLQNYINAAITVSTNEIKERFIDGSIKMSSDYVFVNMNTIPDSTITVSDEEINNFYEKNKEDYKVEAQRKLKYVLFRTLPAKSDTSNIFKNLTTIVEKLKDDTASFKTYVDIYSDQPYSLDTIEITAIPDAAKELLQNAQPGSIVGPVLSNQGYEVFNLKSKFRGKNQFVRASHILIKTGEDAEIARKKANDIYAQLKSGADFAELAIQYSEDPGSGKRGGDLGWFGKGQMVPEFEKASFGGRVGVVQRPVKSTFGYHIIKVTGKNRDKFVVEKITNKINVSPTTIDKIYTSASDFAYLADKNDFDSEAELSNYQVSETSAFVETGNTVPGLGANKAIIRFAFDNSLGSVSDVFKVRLGYVVVMISEINKPTYKPLEDVKEIISRTILNDKKIEETSKIANEIREKIGDSGDLYLAQQVYPKAKVAKAADYTTNGSVSGVGSNAFAFTGYSLNAPIGEVSNPIIGERGAYIIKVTKRTEFDSTAFSIQKNFLRDNILRTKRSTYFNEWVAKVTEEAEVEDNRHIFYR